jgi:3-isopropylmalate/(R)-2-methylmalate dehydratase small subunit
MPLEKIIQVSGRAVNVPGIDIDTDRIIPARFMKCVTFDGLGEYLFYDVRKNEKGEDRDHPLNDARFKGAKILISGQNFGCGSSREHAPQALYRYGFRAVLADSFAEIFFGNCSTLGIPCMMASTQDLAEINRMVNEDPTLELTLDVEKETVTIGGKTFVATTSPSSRDALIKGEWDNIDALVEGSSAVAAKMQAFGWTK